MSRSFRYKEKIKGAVLGAQQSADKEYDHSSGSSGGARRSATGRGVDGVDINGVKPAVPPSIDRTKSGAMSADSFVEFTADELSTRTATHGDLKTSSQPYRNSSGSYSNSNSPILINPYPKSPTSSAQKMLHNPSSGSGIQGQGSQTATSQTGKFFELTPSAANKDETAATLMPRPKSNNFMPDAEDVRQLSGDILEASPKHTKTTFVDVSSPLGCGETLAPQKTSNPLQGVFHEIEIINAEQDASTEDIFEQADWTKLLADPDPLSPVTHAGGAASATSATSAASRSRPTRSSTRTSGSRPTKLLSANSMSGSAGESQTLDAASPAPRGSSAASKSNPQTTLLDEKRVVNIVDFSSSPVPGDFSKQAEQFNIHSQVSPDNSPSNRPGIPPDGEFE